ncbi:dihydroxyacetone kinase subunit DhaL [Clostridium akagii]|uniref:dihydroxyacetone kinase subunit DhaL n=1 Tax=Clostridium akagii TaxID=91623 RepID=UPI00047A2DD1|nr:dihydroxyacetone kinase subunit DhaL [Clostridium akagii]
MEKINKANLKQILGEVLTVLNAEKEHLIELDASMGDGDLGLTMTKGFKCVYDEIDNIDSDDIGVIFMKLGMKMNTTVASTMGTLMSICFIKGAKQVKGFTEIGLEEVVKMGHAAVSGVMERGKAKVGDRTMLDALSPAVDALGVACAEKNNLAEAFEKAFQAAEKGVENTKQLVPVFGRAAYYKDRPLGTPDSGSVAIMFIFKGIKQAVNK